MMRDAMQTEQLLKAGAYPGTQDDHGKTPLHYAALLEDAELCTLLVTARPRHCAGLSDKDGKAEFKKYKDEAAAVLKQYMEESKKDDSQY